MRTNENWPEAFGFTIGGQAPVVILSVEENSVAQRAGLQPGDQILEVNGENVQGLSKEEIILLAKRSRTVPPALAVISRIRTFDLRRRRGRFGFAVRGRGPVFIADVEPNSPAQNVGIRRGDLVLRINGINLRHMNEREVGQMIDTCGPTISIVLIAGAADIGITDKRGGKSSSSRYRRARDFFIQVTSKIDRLFLFIKVLVFCVDIIQISFTFQPGRILISAKAIKLVYSNFTVIYVFQLSRSRFPSRLERIVVRENLIHKIIDGTQHFTNLIVQFAE